METTNQRIYKTPLAERMRRNANRPSRSKEAVLKRAEAYAKKKKTEQERFVRTFDTTVPLDSNEKAMISISYFLGFAQGQRQKESKNKYRKIDFDETLESMDKAKVTSVLKDVDTLDSIDENKFTTSSNIDKHNSTEPSTDGGTSLKHSRKHKDAIDIGDTALTGPLDPLLDIEFN